MDGSDAGEMPETVVSYKLAGSDAGEMPGTVESYKWAPPSDAKEMPEICRDFKNGDCRRGNRCKFTHPESNTHKKVEACHDFQTRGCNRPNCKYAHLSNDALKLYEESGQLPSSNRNNNGMDTLQKALLLDSLYGKRSRTDSLDLWTGLTPMAKKPFTPVAASDVSDVCRDFDREDCRRGARCKYFHPKLRVCRDYQKDKCERESCRFLHMTREEESSYENSGKGPEHISKEDIRRYRVSQISSFGNNGTVMSPLYGGVGIMPSDGMLGGNESGSQICRDFEKGDCSRGSNCKYAHSKLKVCRDFQAEKCTRDNCKFLHLTKEEEVDYEGSGKAPEHIDKRELERSKIMPSNRNSEGARGYSTGRNLGTAGILGGIGNIHPGLDVRNLHTVGAGGLSLVESLIGLPKRDPELLSVLQENEVMSKKIQELQQQVLDLRKMNDTLYDQNMMYRNQRT